jgi:hypothetical protein
LAGILALLCFSGAIVHALGATYKPRVWMMDRMAQDLSYDSKTDLLAPLDPEIFDVKNGKN